MLADNLTAVVWGEAVQNELELVIDFVHDMIDLLGENIQSAAHVGEVAHDALEVLGDLLVVGGAEGEVAVVVGGRGRVARGEREGGVGRAAVWRAVHGRAGHFGRGAAAGRGRGGGGGAGRVVGGVGACGNNAQILDLVIADHFLMIPAESWSFI